MSKYRSPTVVEIMKFEDGDYTREWLIEFANNLYHSGLYKQLQGFYGRFIRDCLVDNIIEFAEK